MKLFTTAVQPSLATIIDRSLEFFSSTWSRAQARSRSATDVWNPPPVPTLSQIRSQSVIFPILISIQLRIHGHNRIYLNLNSLIPIFYAVPTVFYTGTTVSESYIVTIRPFSTSPRPAIFFSPILHGHEHSQNPTPSPSSTPSQSATSSHLSLSIPNSIRLRTPSQPTTYSNRRLRLQILHDCKRRHDPLHLRTSASNSPRQIPNSTPLRIPSRFATPSNSWLSTPISTGLRTPSQIRPSSNHRFQFQFRLLHVTNFGHDPLHSLFRIRRFLHGYKHRHGRYIFYKFAAFRFQNLHGRNQLHFRFRSVPSSNPPFSIVNPTTVTNTLRTFATIRHIFFKVSDSDSDFNSYRNPEHKHFAPPEQASYPRHRAENLLEVPGVGTFSMGGRM